MLGDRSRGCRCSAERVHAYQARLSGPLLDRIDLHVEVPALRYEELNGPNGESSAAVAARVSAARNRQLQRAGRAGALTNSDLDGRCIRELAALGTESTRLLADAVNRMALTGRAHDRLLRVALTLADLEAAPAVGVRHVAEALQFRRCQFDTPSAPIALKKKG